MVGGTISINSLRNVNKLIFKMPEPGVYLLTGENGAGKTTLLACMRRLGFSNAFPHHFPSSSVSEKLDSFVNSKIVYEVNGKSVEYRYRGERWTPQPRKNNVVLSDFGYQQVVYIGATAERITPRPEDFKTDRIKNPGGNIISNANKLFATDRFNELKVVNVTRGVNETYVFKIKTSPIKYYSERNFSLGELCVLKLLKSIESCPPKSLLLIDEIEMALHPSVQVRLFLLLEELAKPKELTVIVSSHSVSLIKTVSRSKSIHLFRENEEIIPVFGSYPSFILGKMTEDEEHTHDSVIYVEDEVAERVVRAMVDQCLQVKHADQIYIRPKVLVTPIGSSDKVVMYLKRHQVTFRKNVKYNALLDGDVREGSIPWMEANKKWKELAKYDEFKEKIKFLPWAPEVGIADHFKNHTDSVNKKIQKLFADPQLRISPINENEFNQAGAKQRSSCKKWFSEQRKNICDRTGKFDDAILTHLCAIFADSYYETNRKEIDLLIQPLI